MKRKLFIVGTLVAGILFISSLSAIAAAEAEGKTNTEHTRENKGDRPSTRRSEKQRDPQRLRGIRSKIAPSCKSARLSASAAGRPWRPCRWGNPWNGRRIDRSFCARPKPCGPDRSRTAGPLLVFIPAAQVSCRTDD